MGALSGCPRRCALAEAPSADGIFDYSRRRLFGLCKEGRQYAPEQEQHLDEAVKEGVELCAGELGGSVCVQGDARRLARVESLPAQRLADRCLDGLPLLVQQVEHLLCADSIAVVEVELNARPLA